MNTRSRIAAALLLAVAGTGAAYAGAKCEAHPKEQWLSEADARARIEAMGFTIKTFKVDGQCYEIYGYKDGKKAEVYFDTKTLDVIKSEIDR